MFSKNHSKKIICKIKNTNIYKKDKRKPLGILVSEMIQKQYYTSINKKYSITRLYKYENKLQSISFFKDSTLNKLSIKNFNNKSTIEPNNDKYYEENNNKQNINMINHSNNSFYIDEYFFPAITLILRELNHELKNKELEKFLTINNDFEKVYKLFLEIMKKVGDNLFPYLTLIFDINKHKEKTNFANKINVILTDNYMNLKRKYVCLVILNQLLSNVKAAQEKEKKDLEYSSDFESSFKSKIFGGGLFQSIMNQNDNPNPKNFKGAIIITKNYTDAIEYYQTLRKFDVQEKLRIKKFGSVHLGIRGTSLKNEKNLINDFITTEEEDKKSETVPLSKLAYITDELAKIKEYNILIFPQEYINLFLKNDSYSYNEGESEYYNRIADFFIKFNPQTLIVDDFDLIAIHNFLDLKKFINNLDIKNFYANNKFNLTGKNHIFISSSIKMKNYFMHIEREKNFDQADINISSLGKSNNSSPSNPAIVEKIAKSFVNKAIVEILDEIYLNNNLSLKFNDQKIDNYSQDANNNAGKMGISDLNLKFFIAKNFLKEKSIANKLFIELERLRDNRYEDKLNKLIRNLKNDLNQSCAIVSKENDFDTLEKNFKVMQAQYKRIDKVIDNIYMKHKEEKKKGMIYLLDEESLKYIDFKFDSFYLFETPDELASYFKIFSLLKDKGKLYILSPSNEYRSKIDFFEDLVKISL